MKKDIKLLLINPPIKNFMEDPFPPLGLAYIAANLERNGYKVKILDMPILQLSSEEVYRYLKSFCPDVVGITCVAANYLKAMKLAKLAKNTCDSIIIVGGPHVTFISEELLQENHCVDVVVRGEGEQTMLGIMDAIIKGESYVNIDGVTYRDSNGRICVNQSRNLIVDMDEFHYPARHLLPMEQYKHITPYTSILTSRGCPYSCTFCSASSFWLHQVRFRKPQHIINEITEIRKRYGLHHFRFVDDIFFLKGRRAEELLRMLKELNIKWSCNTRVDLVDKHTVQMVAEAGCVKMTFGIESLSNKVLNAINKNLDVLRTSDIIKFAEEKGIKTKLNFIIGLPDQTEEDIQKCLKFIEETRPSEVMFAPLTAYPGIEIVNSVSNVDMNFHDLNWWKYESNKSKIKRRVKTSHLSYKSIDSYVSIAKVFAAGLGITNLHGY